MHKKPLGAEIRFATLPFGITAATGIALPYPVLTWTPREPSPLPVVKAMFDEQKKQAGYARLRASDVRIIGVWDDHDCRYGNGR